MKNSYEILTNHFCTNFLYHKSVNYIPPQFQLDSGVSSKISHVELHFFISMTDLEPIFDSCHILPAHSLLGKKQDLHAKARHQKRKIQNNLKNRHILVDQINIIS